MIKIRSYISFFLLALLLFPVADKAVHEVGHLSELHCDVKEKHYCAIEHTCELCDYVFSSQTLPPETPAQHHLFIPCNELTSEALVENTLVPQKFTFTLRGPPQA